MSENDLQNELNTLLEKLLKEQIDVTLRDGMKVQQSRGTKEEANRLRSALNKLRDVDAFEVGDIVVWKEDLKNRKYPEYGQFAIVMETFTEPIILKDQPAESPYYYESLSVRLGLSLPNGKFASYLFDGRRFERVSEDQLD